MDYKEILLETKKTYREELVRQTSELFLTKGIDELKMTDIARELNLGVATLYRYFKTKPHLVLECGCYIWKKYNELFEYVFEDTLFLNKTGADEIHDLLKIFLVLYRGHPQFLLFLRNFDAFVESEKLSPEQLKDYEASILNIYPKFCSCFEKGVQDQSIKNTVNCNQFYFTTTHALMNLSIKLLPGHSILVSDALVSGESQLEMLIDMSMNYIMKEKE